METGFRLIRQSNESSHNTYKSPDDAAVLHGVAMSLKPDSLEEFREHLIKLYPEIGEKLRKDSYFSHRFCNYLPDGGINAAKQYLRRNFSEEYEKQKTRKVQCSSDAKPMDTDREKGTIEYFL